MVGPSAKRGLAIPSAGFGAKFTRFESFRVGRVVYIAFEKCVVRDRMVLCIFGSFCKPDYSGSLNRHNENNEFFFNDN